jgi:uncharacterized oxidoreductase
MPIFSTDFLTRTSAVIFAAAGMREDEARIVAKELVEANCAGHDSHGVIRIPQYLGQIEAGDIVPDAEVEIAREAPILAVLDAHWGFGQVAMSRGVDLGLEKARACGMAAIAVHRANHVGRLGSYVEHIARHNVVALLFVNGAPVCRMAPWGGREARHGTNPVAIGFPSRAGEPVVLDMTTSAVAEGKIRVQRNRGEPVPDGWLIDAEGRPTNDPNTLYAEPSGTILPLGGSLGHKGYGLNIAVELLAGALGGAGCLGKERQFRNGSLLLLLDVEQLVGLDAYFAEADDYIAFVKSAAVAPGFDSILMPGEIELAMKKKRMAEGIFVEEETWGQIVESAGKVGAEVGEG